MDLSNAGGNTGTINYDPTGAGFQVISPNAAPSITTDPTVKYQTKIGSTSLPAVTQHTVITPQVFPHPPAPGPVDTSNLARLQAQVQKKNAIAQAMKDYDQLSAATQATGFQSANNAGNVYANRLLQSGVNPLASGVVAAQAKLPVYKELADINNQKDQTRLDATNKADSLAASIASNIANIQLGYTKMLADYNQQQTGYNLDLTKFGANLGQQQYQYQQDYALKAAQVAGQLGTSSSASSSGRSLNGMPIADNFNPGYITNAGPIQAGTGYAMANGNNVFMGQPGSVGNRRPVLQYH